MESKTLGVLGGLGPMSSAYFYEMLTAHTKAERDSDHLNILISSRADTPDRTDYILGTSDRNPLPVMNDEVKKLIGAGADMIAIPCNTAHYFYEGISASADVPVINIIRQTALFCFRSGFKRVGLLATDGTVLSGAYAEIFSKAQIECVTPDENDQAKVMDIIYGKIKKGIMPEKKDFLEISDKLFALGCEKVILGCTELSLLKREFELGDEFIDSLEVLALSAIKLCGKEPMGFSDELMSFKP